jgi:hypothetical protein
MAKKKSKSEKIPALNTPFRDVVTFNINKLPDYKEKLKKGYPLFTQKELENIEKRYTDGLTWVDIENELLGKKIILKKPTFRKYIQEKNLPSAIGYKNVGQKRFAVFPKYIIHHINFLHYFYKLADAKTIDTILKLFTNDKYKMTYLEAIESKLPFSDSLYPSILRFIGSDDSEAYVAIEETLSARPKDQEKALSMLEKINNKFETIIDKDISKLISFLKENTINPTEIPDDNKKGG